VTEVTESPTEGLVLVLDMGTIQLNPSLADLVGPEIAACHAAPPDTAWMVWRPGETPLDALT
jgi:hypothetical protein